MIRARVGVDVLEDFDNGRFGGQKGDEAIDDGVAGAVDEGGALVGVGDQHEPVVDDFAGGDFRVAGEVVGFALPVEQFVAEEAALGVEDGLAAEETVGRGRGGSVVFEVEAGLRISARQGSRHRMWPSPGE